MGQKGSLRNHGHGTTSGDGGQLSNLAIVGVATETGTPANATDIPTVSYEQSNILLWN